jgi:hypothetical protein
MDAIVRCTVAYMKTILLRFETLLHGYILAFFLCLRLEQVICTGTRSQTRCHIRLDMCLTIICGMADIRPASSLTADVSTKGDLQQSPCSALHYQQGGSRQI